jgi:hypothetical protein
MNFRLTQTIRDLKLLKDPGSNSSIIANLRENTGTRPLRALPVSNGKRK